MSVTIVALAIGFAPNALAEEWSFRIAPYAWMAGIEGDVKPFDAGPATDVDLSFSDILENLDIAAFVAAEARRGDFFLRGDFSYAAVSASGDTPGPAFSEAEVESKTLQASGVLGWSFFRDDQMHADVFAGARLWRISTDLDLSGGQQPAASFSSTETFVDPIIGLSGGMQVLPDVTLAVSASLGGFGVGADLEYGGTIAAFWQAGEHWGLAGGYRYLAVDYETGGFIYDIAQHGPFLGVFFVF